MTHQAPRPVGADWMWRCPHCKDEPRSIVHAIAHLYELHGDCWSCRVETLMLRGVRDGVGHIYEGTLPF